MNESDSVFDIHTLIQEARIRWLKPAEVQFILQNHENYPFTEVVSQNPKSGSFFLFNKRVVKFFRKDGHIWRKKKSGRTVGEGHERLKVGKIEALNCYYAQGEENPNFRRRIYWMLDPAYDHIVLVHYRDISEGRHNAETISSWSLPSTSYLESNMAQNHCSISAVSESYETYQDPSPFSIGSMDVSSDLFDVNNLLYEWGIPEDFNSLLDADTTQAEQRIAEHLSLADNNMGEISHQCLNEKSEDSEVLLCERRSDQDEFLSVQHGSEYRENGQQSCDNEKLQSSSERDQILTNLDKQHEADSSQCLNPSASNTDNRNSCPSISNFHPIASLPETSLLHAVENTKNYPYSGGTSTDEVNPYYYAMLFDEETQPGTPTGVVSRLTIGQKQMFSIKEISPEWGYSAENSKVIITGYFHCNPLEHAWKCMFGDTEVPVEIIQEGVLRCHTPPHIPGKVSLCITTGNREACSEVREFEYRMAPTSSVQNNNLPQRDGTKSTEELQLLIRFVQMLLCDTLVHNVNGGKSGTNTSEKSNLDKYLWENMNEGLLVGSESESSVMNWLLQELVKEKLPHWLLSKFKEGETPGSTRLKKEQEIIHMVAGLGFKWALNPILSSGIGINFRDINGWTPLHHAAYFGREEMVVALIVAGASPSAVTDPTSEDPTGQSPGSIAASRGHKGLAGYLSELALTSHLKSLTLEESEISKENSAMEAEVRVESLSNESLGCTDDQHSLQHSLAAVRNAALAAARIQSAFRALSFKRRREREALVSVCEEYGITAANIPALSAISKLTFPRLCDHVLEKAAVIIQKKYRGQKGHRAFLALRQKIILIQAHVRGHLVRQKYKVIVWAVRVLDMVLLRWRHKRVGLRGLQHESESVDGSDDEEILKVFRKKKVDATIQQAVSWVISMAHSTGARRQYRRLLESYRQAKAELCTESSSTSRDNFDNMKINNNNDNHNDDGDDYHDLWFLRKSDA